MKIARIFVLGLLTVCSICCCRPAVAKPVPSGEAAGIESLKDSLIILDSLVRMTRTNNNALSLQYARDAWRIAQRIGTNEALVEAEMLLGLSFIKNYKDSSFFYFNRAITQAANSNLLEFKVKLTYDLAILYGAALDYKQSVILLDSTIRLAEAAKKFDAMADAYNSLGNIYSDLHDNSNAKLMFSKSFNIAREHGLFKQMGVALGNLAKFESEVNESVRMQKEAITYLKKTNGTEEEVAYVLINIGNRYTKPDSALFYYKKALSIVKDANAKDIIIGAYNNMAYSYLDLGKIDQAEDCLVEHAIPLALAEKNDSWLSTLYDSYADILVAKGSFKEAVTWQKKALKTVLESDRLKASGQVRLLAALLDVKSKELTIQNKEREILIQQNRLQQARFWLILSVLFILGSVFISLWILQRSRMKMQHQQITSARRLIEMEEGEKGRTARELHDITGQLIMGITGAIENLDLPDEKSKNEIRGKIKDLGQSIRLISHRMNKAMLEHFTFKELITGQCEDIQKLTGIPVFLDMVEDYTDLPEEMVLHTYRIVQELLTNASKYAKDGNVSISLTTRNNQLILSYSDTGPGFDLAGLKDGGMGLLNIFERAKLLGGQAKVDSSPGQGTKWEISIPHNIKKLIPNKTVNA
jgi:two-component system, NarL family, sensor kinase